MRDYYYNNALNWITEHGNNYDGWRDQFGTCADSAMLYAAYCDALDAAERGTEDER